MNKYLIKQSLVDVELCKVTHDEKKYGKSLVELTDEELQEKIKGYKNLGFQVATYHQEDFGNDWRFVEDGKGLDDIEDMNYSQSKYLLNQCKNEVDNICRKEILNKNINKIRYGDYSFCTNTRVYNILQKYAGRYGKSGKRIILLESLLYFVNCVGNIFQTIEIIEKLKKQGIYIYFLDVDSFSGELKELCFDVEYLDTLLNEFYLEKLLAIMRNKGELSTEQYSEYSCFFDEPSDEVCVMETEEFSKCMDFWDL